VKEWLEVHGFGVVDTGLTRSDLAGPGIRRAKSGHNLDPITLNLFYATDFFDRLERLIIPALRAGMVVVADRYTFSMIARAAARGVDSSWMADVYSFAPVPDCVIYLDVDVDQLVPRILANGRFDYWESGQDFMRGDDVFSSFLEYQTEILAQFGALVTKHSFSVIDARGSITQTFASILTKVKQVVADMRSSTDY
jgi:dTMP kinase